MKLSLLIKMWFCFLLVVMSACAKKEEQKKDPITLVFDVFPGYGHVFLAKSMGFFQKNGVNVVLRVQKEYLSVKKALDDGSADAVFIVYPEVLMAVEHGLRYKVVYLCDYSLTADVIVGRPEYTSVADLKGKTISFEGVNSFSNIFVLSVLEKHRLNEFDVRFANLPASQVLQALEYGAIDAGHVWEPYKSRALQCGYKILAQAKDVPIGIIADTLAVKETIIKERPLDVLAIVKSLFQALEYIRKNPNEAMAIMAREGNISVEEVKAGFEGVFHPNLEENYTLLTSKVAPSLNQAGKMIVDFYLKRGQVSGIDMKKTEEILDPTFVKALMDEKGADKK